MLQSYQNDHCPGKANEKVLHMDIISCHISRQSFFLKLSDKPLRGHAPRQDDIDPKFVVAEKQGIEVKSALTLNDVQGFMPASIQLQPHLLNLTQVTNPFDDQDKTSIIFLNIPIGSISCIQSILL